MALPKKPMTDNEKKAKLTALKGAHKAASDVMTQSLTGRKDSKSLKDHVAQMSKDEGIDFKGDSDHIIDPQRLGNVVGRHISDENATHAADDQSVYDPNDLNSVEARLQELMKMKRK
jgi:DNA repair ATPase RecN